MTAKVFVSYRREDSAAYAGRIQDRLEREFGRNFLFIDVDAIPLGVNFVNVLREEVGKCRVLLALIGADWLDARDERGNRRLSNPNDFVRIEIATALRRSIPVIPILLDGITAPRAEQLPEDLEELALRNALNVHHASFHSDMAKLIRGLKGHLGTPAPLPPETARPQHNGSGGASVRLTIAQTLRSKAIALGAIGRNDEAIAVYDDLLARFGGADELPLREQVAIALYSKGLRYDALGRGEDEIGVYDELLARFGNAPETELSEQVANALTSKGITLGSLGRHEDAIAVFDNLVARFGDATELPLREQVARALYSKALRYDALGLSQDEISVYDDLLARFGDATEASLREQVAKALTSKGITLRTLGRNDEAIAIFDDILARFSGETESGP